MSWVFQAVTKRYDLRREMKEGKSVTWLATRYRGEIKKDDTVYFWQAGPPQIRGMYGWGVIAGNVKRYKGWGYGIQVTYKKVFDPHIPAAVFKRNSLLQKHVLLRMPIGTNFKLNPAEDEEIRKIIAQKLGKEAVP